jgi:hypothetical protein
MYSTIWGGWDLAECGWDLAECGWDLAESGWDLAEWLERLTANAVVIAVLGSIPASSDTVESEGAADTAVLNFVHKKKKIFKKSPFTIWEVQNFGTFLLEKFCRFTI